MSGIALHVYLKAMKGKLKQPRKVYTIRQEICFQLPGLEIIAHETKLSDGDTLRLQFEDKWRRLRPLKLGPEQSKHSLLYSNDLERLSNELDERRDAAIFRSVLKLDAAYPSSVKSPEDFRLL